MTISLSKGGNISLTKEAPTMTKAVVGLGWDVNPYAGGDMDLDASALLLASSGKVRSDADFIFYNQPKSADRSVVHTGDNRSGEGDGDDEQIIIGLSSVPSDVETIRIAVTIHDESGSQNFGQVDNAFIRVVNQDSGEEIARYDLTEDYSTENALVFGEIYRKGSEWRFKAVGKGYEDGLAGLARHAGVNV